MTKRNKDAWYFAGGPGEYGHPKKRDWGPRQPQDGWQERAEQALNNGSIPVFEAWCRDFPDYLIGDLACRKMHFRSARKPAGGSRIP